jgi:hypothetical protein
MFLKHKYSTTDRLLFCLIAISLIYVIETLFGVAHLTVISLILTLYYFYLLLFKFSKSKNELNNSLLYIGLLLWTIITLIRGFNIEETYISNLFLSQYVFLPFTFPFAVRCFSATDIKRIPLIIHYINIFYLFFIIMYLLKGSGDIAKSITYSEIINKYFAYPNFLLLFSIKLQSRKVKILSLIVFFTGLLFSIINARRGMVFTFSSAGIISIFLYFFDVKKNVFKNVTFYLCIAVLFITGYSIYMYYQQQVFGKLLDRINEDTRSSVINDFNRDMASYDFVVGKGIGGTYRVRDYAWVDNAVKSNQRDGIEEGYLDIILRGGYIYLILLLLIYCFAMYKGFFKSNNVMAKAFAAFILLHILELYPSGNLLFNIRYLLIWFSVAMCYNKNILRASNNQIAGLFMHSRKRN